MKVNHCQATTTRGEPCVAQPIRPSGFCYWHDPALDGERQANRRKGGEGRSNANRVAKRLPKELSDVKLALLRALHDVESGQLEPARASAMARLAAVLLAVDQRGSPETPALQRIAIHTLTAIQPTAGTERTDAIEANYQERTNEHAIDNLRASTAAHTDTKPPIPGPTPTNVEALEARCQAEGRIPNSAEATIAWKKDRAEALAREYDPDATTLAQRLIH